MPLLSLCDGVGHWARSEDQAWKLPPATPPSQTTGSGDGTAVNEESIELEHQNSGRAQQTPTPRKVPMGLSRSWAFEFLYIFFIFISKVVHGGHLPWKLWADMKLLPRPTQSLPLYLLSC